MNVVPVFRLDMIYLSRMPPTGERTMLIRVVYDELQTGKVQDSYLDNLIRQEKIVGFFRSSGFVRIGRDPIRGGGGKYMGAERRQQMMEKM